MLVGSSSSFEVSQVTTGFYLKTYTYMAMGWAMKQAVGMKPTT